MFKFEEIFGAKIFPELQGDMLMIKLDLSLAAKAVFSTRAYDIFEPFPTYFLKEREERKRTVFSAKGGVDNVNKENKNLDRIKSLFKCFPKLEDLKTKVKSETDVLDEFKKYYPVPDDLRDAYRLSTYVIATNRLSLSALAEIERIPELPSNCIQLIVTNLNPEFERKFEINKAKYGSEFLFHGSSQENWYSILRNGLRVLSNTKYMTAGAAYGAGIYGSNNVHANIYKINIVCHLFRLCNAMWIWRSSRLCFSLG